MHDFFPFTAQFQTMNIGNLGQPNVVAIQHQGRNKLCIINDCYKNVIFKKYIFFNIYFICYITDIIQHPQSNVVTLPATILTATVAGTPGPGVSVPPPGVHIPPHTGPLVPPPQAQVRD